MKKRISLAFLAACLAAAPLLAATDASVRVFVLKHKRVEEAALLIRPHLSESASVTLTQRLNAMTVTDREDRLGTIARVLSEFDTPPRGFSFAVRLVRARADVPAGSISQEIGGLGAKLRSLLQFNDYTLIDSTVLRGVEGQSVEYRLGEEFLLTFLIGPAAAGDDLILSPFSLSRVRRDEGGRTRRVTLYRAPMPITLNQTLVVGASKEESSKTALILILLAQEIPRGGAEKGAADTKTVEKKP